MARGAAVVPEVNFRSTGGFVAPIDRLAIKPRQLHCAVAIDRQQSRRMTDSQGYIPFLHGDRSLEQQCDHPRRRHASSAAGQLG